MKTVLALAIMSAICLTLAVIVRSQAAERAAGLFDKVNHAIEEAKAQ